MLLMFWHNIDTHWLAFWCQVKIIEHVEPDIGCYLFALHIQITGYYREISISLMQTYLKNDLNNTNLFVGLLK